MARPIGYKHTEETKKKLSDMFQGRFLGRVSPRKGVKLSQETKDRISGSKKGTMMGKDNPFYGKTHTEETKRKIKLFKKGQRPWNYIDGRSKLVSPGRYGDDWEAIRYLVYKRDHFTCQDCAITKSSLDIHHIVPFLSGGSNELDNLIALCRKCHMKAEHRLRKEIILEVD